MSNAIIIFTMKGCSNCTELKNSLNELKIPFTELPIDEYRRIWEQVVKQTGFRNLPTIFIKEDYTDTGPVYIPGRDFDTKDQIIEIIKGHL